MNDDMRDRLAEELRAVASDMLTKLDIPVDQLQAFDDLRNRILSVAWELDTTNGQTRLRWK